MQTFLLIVILILIVIDLRQADELRNLEKKLLIRSELYAKKLMYERKKNKCNF